MNNKVLFFIGVLFIFIFWVGCGSDDGTPKVKPNRDTFLSGVTSSKLVNNNAPDTKTEEEYIPATEEELDRQWNDNLKKVGEQLNSPEYNEFKIDSKGPGNTAIKTKLEQVGDPIIYVKEVMRNNKPENQSFAKIKFKLTVENNSKQDCAKLSVKLYFYDGRGNRIVDREQSLFFKDLKAGKSVTKDIVIEDIRAWERKRTKDYAVNFSKAESFVVDSKFIFN